MKPLRAKFALQRKKAAYLLLEQLRTNIAALDFQEFCAGWMKRHGYVDVECGGVGPDTGIDFWGYFECPHATLKVLGQAKQTDVVGRPVIDQMGGRIAWERATRVRSQTEADLQDEPEVRSDNPIIVSGIVMTTGSFTSGAKDSARSLAITLVDGVNLAKDLVRLGIGIDVLTEDTVRIRDVYPLDWFA